MAPKNKNDYVKILIFLALNKAQYRHAIAQHNFGEDFILKVAVSQSFLCTHTPHTRSW